MGIKPRWIVGAFLWGFAEATRLAIIPDVLLTLAAIRLGWKSAMKLVPFTLGGALLGGATMYLYAETNLAAARETVDSVPLISMAMIERVEREIQELWLWQMIIGALTGTPYKIYAISAPGAGIPLWLFISGSVLARIIRWILLICAAALFVAVLRRLKLVSIATPSWAIIWVLFYGVFVLF